MYNIKNRIQKSFISLISVLLLVSILIPNCVNAAASVSLGTVKSDYYIGDEITMAVNLRGASIATYTIRVTADSSKVDYISGPSNSNYSNGKVIYTWTDPNGGASPITGGVLATFKFRAKNTGRVTFSVTGDFYAPDESVVTPTFSPRSINIYEKVASTPPDTGTEGDTDTGTGNGGTAGDTNPGTGNGGTAGDTNTGTGNGGTVGEDTNIGSGSGNTNIGSGSTIGGTSNSTNNGVTVNSTANAYLKSLQLNVEGITPKFSRNITQYYITVPNSVQSIDINAVPENSKSKVAITGNKNLKTGLNKISILLTAPDGKTKKTYMINVTKTDDPNKANTNLENLAIEQCTIVPEFSNDITEYSCNLIQDLSSLNILAVPQNPNAKVEILGNENLQFGENVIQVNITAEDGFSVKTYKIFVNKIDKNEQIIEDENVENNQNEQKSETREKNGAVLPLSILGVVALISGICYKKFSRKRKK